MGEMRAENNFWGKTLQANFNDAFDTMFEESLC